MRTPDISAQIEEIAADPNAYVAETRRRARASAAPLSSLADHADERFTEAQRAKVAEFDAAEEPEEVVAEKLRTTIAVLRDELAESIRASGVWRARLEAVEALADDIELGWDAVIPDAEIVAAIRTALRGDRG